MNISCPASLSLIDAREAMAKDQLSPVEYIDALLAHISATDAKINAFIFLDSDGARLRAVELEKTHRANTDLPPLYGIPFAVKDNIDVKGMVTTCQSRVMPLLPAGENAAVVERLVAAGAICLGKLGMYEFGEGATDDDNPWPRAQNPLNAAYTAGSSSSGSGVAVAAGFVAFSLGTDTSGSVRNPAMMTGVVGLKPTTSSIAMRGIVPGAKSLDTVGPLARHPDDLDVVMECLNPNYKDFSPPVLSNPLVLGHIRHFWESDVEPAPDVRRVMTQLVEDIKDKGAQVREVSLEPLSRYREVCQCILEYELHQFHAIEFEKRPQFYGSSLQALLKRAGKITRSSYENALQHVTKLQQDVEHALRDCDALFTAVSAVPPCRSDDITGLRALDEGSVRAPFSVSGHPALSVPVGLSDEGMPIACQWVVRHHEERKLLDRKGDERSLSALIKALIK